MLVLANFFGRGVPRAQVGVPDPGGRGGRNGRLVVRCTKTMLRCEGRSRMGWSPAMHRAHGLDAGW